MANLLTKLLEAKFKNSRDGLIIEALKPIKAELHTLVDRSVREHLERKGFDIKSNTEKIDQVLVKHEKKISDN
jgi:hypothetical protein